MIYTFDFVGYHMSVLNGTVRLSEYEHYFSKPFSDLLSYTDDDLVLAVELFGPYFAEGGHTYESQLIKYSIGQGLVSQLRLLGFTGTDDDLSLFFTQYKDVSCIEYDVTTIDGFLLFGHHDIDRIHNYYFYKLNVQLLGCMDVSFVELIKEYMFMIMGDNVSLAYPCVLDITGMFDGQVTVSLLEHHIKGATLSFTNCVFYKKMRMNMLVYFLLIMGDERINGNEVAAWCRYDPSTWTKSIINSSNITYRELLNNSLLMLMDDAILGVSCGEYI